VHCAKNYMHKSLSKIKVPLILGVWGGKGQGKTFQVSLSFKAMNVEAIIMSAGELEAGNAGEPAKLVRQRYREAGDFIRKNKMAALFINDLDAGAGRMGESTQYTVNNQMVNATLMNIADNPTNVQLPGVYKSEDVPRVPIICTGACSLRCWPILHFETGRAARSTALPSRQALTRACPHQSKPLKQYQHSPAHAAGNDFSTLYAPLIRDGRMEKYYWNPSRADRIGVCLGIFKEDELSNREVEELVDNFPGQSIDFFGALRARIYDDAVRGYANSIGIDNLSKSLVRPGKPVTLPKPSMTMNLLMDYGQQLVSEQDNVKRVQLAEEYIAGASLAGETGSSIPEAYKAR
jgi:hypothetical protein